MADWWTLPANLATRTCCWNSLSSSSLRPKQSCWNLITRLRRVVVPFRTWSQLLSHQHIRGESAGGQSHWQEFAPSDKVSAQPKQKAASLADRSPSQQRNGSPTWLPPCLGIGVLAQWRWWQSCRYPTTAEGSNQQDRPGLHPDHTCLETPRNTWVKSTRDWNVRVSHWVF